VEEKILEECALYFRKDKAYTCMFAELKKKYIKYGRLSGKIFLANLSEAECVALGKVFGRSLLPGDFVFSVSELQVALNETRFCGVEMEALVERYFEEKLVSNSRRREEKKACNNRFWEAVLDEVGSRFGEDAGGTQWLKGVREQRKYGYHLIIREREKSSDSIKEMLMEVCGALAYLSREDRNGAGFVRLAVLGAEVTKNPHCFDRQNAPGRLLISALSYIYREEEPTAQEDILALYYKAGIAPDDISSYTTCYGIHFYEGDREHEAYRHFIGKGEKYVLTLSNLSRLTRADSGRKKVFIIENQMVFSQVCDEMDGEEYAIVCTSGQPRTASLFLIDLLLKSECKLYYCGDIDPEGIEIADRVLTRGKGKILPWRMTAQDYYRSLSDEALTEKRLNRLDKIANAQLRELAELLKAEKKAGYQEHLIDLMVGDIRTE
jgi:uncharacterized protein (TIGR02679 family)